MSYTYGFCSVQAVMIAVVTCCKETQQYCYLNTITVLAQMSGNTGRMFKMAMVR